VSVGHFDRDHGLQGDIEFKKLKKLCHLSASNTSPAAGELGAIPQWQSTAFGAAGVASPTRT